MTMYDIKKAIKHIGRVDPKLGEIIKDIGVVEIPRRRRTAFDGLIRIILGQQLSGASATSIYRRVKAVCGDEGLTADRLDRLSDTQIKSAGVSSPKLRTMRNIVRSIEDGSLNLRRIAHLDDERAFEELTAVKGIGAWTANIYLMFVLGRPDVFPSTDLGIVTTMRRVYGIKGTDEQLNRIAERWRPYRSIACWYLWQSARRR
jgi:DNA-3-methyladenine glycosylase II